MFTLLNPIWLLSLLGLSVPVLIHLWNIKQGKTLRVGSIALLGSSSKQSSRSLKLNEWFLLLLRCLLIVLLAFFLAGPIVKHADSSNRQWVLLERENFRETYKQFKPQIDSLLKLGFNIHEFRPGFAETSLEDVLKDTTELAGDSDRISYWSLLNLLEQSHSVNKVYLFTTNLQNRFSGIRPVTSLNLEWKTYTPADSIHTWIQEASLTAGDSIRILKGISKPSGTTFTRQIIGPSALNIDFTISSDNGQLFVKLKRATGSSFDSSAFPIDTTETRIAIYSKHYPEDAGYIAAAAKAFQKFSGKKIRIVRLDKQAELSGKFHVVFWLSDELISAGLLNQFGTLTKVIRYQKGKPVAVTSSIESSIGQTDLFKRIAYKGTDKHPNATWRDAFGDPILEKENENTYTFYSHFNPEWNDLVWNEKFPELIMGLVFQPGSVKPANDRRILSAGQYLPLSSREILKTGNFSAIASKDISSWFWNALFILFGIERWIAFRQKAKQVYA